MTGPTPDVLVVGAGPTGLALAAQLVACGVRPRVVDRGHDRVHESRALAIQPRTLEVLAGLGVTERLLALGNRAVQLQMHVRERVLAMQLFDLGLDDTAYPFLLFLSQAETERILGEHLAAAGVRIEWGVELVDLGWDEHGSARARLRRADGAAERVRPGYVVGCDGAHSAVRRLAGIGFEGSSYPQTFVLADVDADGIEPGAAHAFLAERGLVFFFPLAQPAAWRLIAMRPPADPTPPDAPVDLAEVQALADRHTNGSVRLHDPVWLTNFRLHHRAAARYRSGPIFLAGDAAHIHSPAGAQGMNTGIQDAVNLGWKLAQVVNGLAPPAILDTYQTERRPVGRTVLRFTDRAFRVATSTNPVIRFARTRLVPAVIPWVLRARRGRAYAFRIVSELSIHYRASKLSLEGPNCPRRGPRAGDRLPDAHIVHSGEQTTLHGALASPHWRLLLCGPAEAWPDDPSRTLGTTVPVRVHRLAAQGGPGVLVDQDGTALRRLGLAAGDVAHYLVRPDGHIGYRAGGTDLTGLTRYLRRWLPGTGTVA